MVRHKEVEQLYVLAHREFAQYLGDRLIKSSYNERKGFNATLSTVRQKLRPYFLEHIPTAGIIAHGGAAGTYQDVRTGLNHNNLNRLVFPILIWKGPIMSTT